MSTSMWVLIVVVALAAVWFFWGRNRVKDTMSAPAPATAAGSSGSTGGGAALGSYDDYRRTSPSNMVYGKLTCNRCGSNLIRAEGGVGRCTNCGAQLYRA